jgi:hypothetical protein
VPEGKDELVTVTGMLSPRAIRAAVLTEERPAFERQFGAAMATAAETLDLSGVLELLRAWQRIGELTARGGPENRRQILAKAVQVWRNRGMPDPDAARRSREVDDVLRERLSKPQCRELDPSRDRMRLCWSKTLSSAVSWSTTRRVGTR